MGVVATIADSLRNAVLGAGTKRDPRTANSYVAGAPLTKHQIDAA